MEPGVDSHTVVRYREHPLGVKSKRKKNDRRTVAAVLNAIADQIEQTAASIEYHLPSCWAARPPSPEPRLFESQHPADP